MKKTKVSQLEEALKVGANLTIDATANESQSNKFRTRRLSSESEHAQTTTQAESKLMDNEMRSFRNRGFHDGYDKGKKATLQSAYDCGYKKAFEHNFILSTLKGVANALKSSHRNSQRCASSSYHNQGRPTSAVSSASTPTSSSATSSTTSTPHSTMGRRSVGVGLSSSTSEDTAEQICSISSSRHHHASSPSERRGLYNQHRHSAGGGGDIDASSTCSTSSSVSSNLSSSNTTSNTAGVCYGSSSNNFNVSISSDHMSLLESMKFDQSSDIESIKKDLIKICRENRLQILAHYVSQIG